MPATPAFASSAETWLMKREALNNARGNAYTTAARCGPHHVRWKKLCLIMGILAWFMLLVPNVERVLLVAAFRRTRQPKCPVPFTWFNLRPVSAETERPCLRLPR